MTVPGITTTQLDGALGVLPASAGRPYACVGTSSSGTAATPALYARVSDVVSTFGQGPNVEDACYHIQRTGRPVLITKAATVTDGSYGTPVNGITGTSVVAVAASVKPYDLYDFIFEVVTGGTRGTAGIKYRYSLDGGENWSATIALGTDVAITTAAGNVGLTFAAGTLVAGDRFSVRTVAPIYDSTSLLAALTALGQSTLPWEIVHVGGAVSATFAGVIESWMTGLAAASKNRAYVCNARVPAVSESEATYSSSIGTDFASFTTKHGLICAGACDLPSSVSGRPYRTPASRGIGSRQAVVDVQINIANIDQGGPIPGARIRDSLGNVKHHDEAVNPGLDALGFCVLRTWDNEPGVYVNRPRLMSGATSDFQLMPHRRVMNTGIDTCLAYLRRRLSKDILVDPETGYISEADATEMEKAANALLLSALTSQRKASRAWLVVSRTDNILSTATINFELRIVPLGYPDTFVLTAGFVNPALNAVTA